MEGAVSIGLYRCEWLSPKRIPSLRHPDGLTTNYLGHMSCFAIKTFLTVLRLMFSYRIHNGTPCNSIDLEPRTRKLIDGRDFCDHHHLFFKKKHLLHLHLGRFWNLFHCWSVQVFVYCIAQGGGRPLPWPYIFLTNRL